MLIIRNFFCLLFSSYSETNKEQSLRWHKKYSVYHLAVYRFFNFLNFLTTKFPVPDSNSAWCLLFFLIFCMFLFYYLLILCGQNTDIFQLSFHDVDLESAEELYQRRITRILTSDFPKYFALVTRIRHDTASLGPDGGLMSSRVNPQVQAVFPPTALTKPIKVGLQVIKT